MNKVINISNIKKFQKLLTPSNIKQVVKAIKYLISFCKYKKSDKITPIEKTIINNNDVSINEVNNNDVNNNDVNNNDVNNNDVNNNGVNIVINDEPIIIQFFDESQIPHEIKIFNKTNTIEIYNSSQPYKNKLVYDNQVYKYENYNNIFIDINNHKYKNNSDYKYEIKLSNDLYVFFN
jgi:hypothetical protein